MVYFWFDVFVENMTKENPFNATGDKWPFTTKRMIEVWNHHLPTDLITEKERTNIWDLKYLNCSWCNSIHYTLNRWIKDRNIIRDKDMEWNEVNQTEQLKKHLILQFPPNQE